MLSFILIYIHILIYFKKIFFSVTLIRFNINFTLKFIYLFIFLIQTISSFSIFPSFFFYFQSLSSKQNNIFILINNYQELI